MRKFLSRLLICLIVINTITTSFTAEALASIGLAATTNSGIATISDNNGYKPGVLEGTLGVAGDPFVYHQNSSLQINNEAVVLSSTQSEKEILVSMDVSSADTYTVTAPQITYDEDGNQEILQAKFVFSVDSIGRGKLTYTLDGQLDIYSEDVFSELGRNNSVKYQDYVPPVLEEDEETGEDIEVEPEVIGYTIFEDLAAGSALAFFYEETIVKFYWSKAGTDSIGNVLYLSVSDVEYGYTYPFKLTTNTQGRHSMDILKGISKYATNTTTSFSVSPYANAGEELTGDGEIFINQNEGQLAGDIVRGIKFEFPAPYDIILGTELSDNKAPTYYREYQSEGSEDVNLTIQLTHTDSSKSETVHFANIYGYSEFDESSMVGGTLDSELDERAAVKYDSSSKIVTALIEGLDSSLLFKDATLELKTNPPTGEKSSFLVTAPFSTTSNGYYAYTYPEFIVVPLDGRFYLELKPFQDEAGYYTIYQKNYAEGDTSQSLGSEYRQREFYYSSSGIETIYRDVEMTFGSRQVFQVTYSLTGTGTNYSPITSIAVSQLLIYDPDPNDILLGAAQDLYIAEDGAKNNIIRDRATEQNEDGTASQVENLYLTLGWTIGKSELIENLLERDADGQIDFNYVFFKDLEPLGDYGDTPFMGVNIPIDTTTFSTKDEITGVVDSTPELLNQDLVGNDFASQDQYTEWMGIIDKNTKVFLEYSGGTEYLKAEVAFRIPVSSELERLLQYINIYFLVTQGQYTINSDDPDVADVTYETQQSNYVVLPLDGVTDIKLSTPQDIAVIQDTADTTAYNLTHTTMFYENPNEVLYSYNEIMRKNRGQTLQDDSISYNFYITQNKSVYDDLLDATSDTNIITYLAEHYTYTKQGFFDEIKDEFGIKTLNGGGEGDGYYTSDEWGFTLDIAEHTIDGQTVLDILQDGGIVELAGMAQNNNLVKQNIRFENLDKNQAYYVIGQTTGLPYLDDEDEEGNNTGDPIYDELDYSIFSPIYTVTTSKTDQTPSEDSKSPSAPTEFYAENITQSTANIIWINETDPELTETTVLEYHFIRTKGISLQNEFLSTKYDYDYTWELLDGIDDKVGLMTNSGELLEYNGSNFETADPNRFSFVVTNEPEKNILDMTLSPNSVYYYYVRTIRVTDGDEKAYSAWIPLTITTLNVTAPENLRIEYTAIDYDPYTEAVISFDMPRIDLSLLGVEFEMQYSIKKDMETWQDPVTIDPSLTDFNYENADSLTMRAMYTIVGLETGSLYTIRVRMYNLELDSPSMYSNEVEYRTETDPNDQSHKEDLEGWEQGLDDLIEDLKTQPNWNLVDTSFKTTIYYRPGYFDGIIKNSNVSYIDLVASTEVENREYYLPASAVIGAFNANKGFRISHGTTEVLITAQAINPNEDASIKYISEQLELKNSDIEDYFVKIAVSFSDNSYPIANATTMTPLTTVSVQAIETNQTIATYDSKMINMLEDLQQQDEFYQNFMDLVLEMLEDEQESIHIYQELNWLITAFKAEFGEQAYDSLEDMFLDTHEIIQLYRDIIIASPMNDNVAVSGYARLDGWEALPVREYMSKKAIYTSETGKYILSGEEILIQGLGNAPNSQKITLLIQKYSLQELIGTDVGLQSESSRSTVLGVFARLAGSDYSQDPVQFFNSNGLSLASKTVMEGITTEESIYVAMKTYELRTGQNINALKISNYSLANDLVNLNAKYKSSVQAGFEIGVLTTSDITPKDTITNAYLFEMIGNMASIVNL